ncbi:MAG: MBL fold metallo-hydrolase [Mycobacteriales bacterium]|nr:MAG: MBL fold metallo-hydrolase [Pseudonocardiales bacterium]
MTRAAHPAYGVLREVTPDCSVLLADNPSPMTLDGTNSWVIRRRVVVDPGPDDAAHLAALAAAGEVELILITHRHADHTAGARRLHELTGAPVRAVDPAHRIGGGGLVDGEMIRAGDLPITVLATPGHTADSVCLLVGDALLSGDTVLGRGTTVIAEPDGRLGDYLASLRRFRDLAQWDPWAPLRLLPGHGPEHRDAGAVAARYLAHREDRLEQVRAALSHLGPQAGADDVVAVVYADVDRALWPAAAQSVRAMLRYLREA